MRTFLLTDADVFAGTERHIAALAKGLAGCGVEPLVGCPAGSPLAGAVTAAGIEHVGIQKRGPMDRRAVGRVARLLREGRVDLVHAHNGRTAMIAALARRLARGGGDSGLVLTQHFITPARAGRPLVVRVPAGAAHRWVAGQAGRVIAVSQAVRDAILERGDAPPGKVVTIPNGIEPPAPMAPGQPAVTRRELGVDAEQPLVVCLARLEREKDIATLVRAMAAVTPQYPTARCVIAGQGRQRAELQAGIEQRGLANHVRLLGFRDDANQLLAAADVVALPSPAEAFGLAVIEAMAAGKPVIAVDAGGPREIVESGNSGLLVAPADAGAMAKAIIDLIASPGRREALGRGGYERYRANYTAEVMARRTAGVYAAAISEALAASGATNPDYLLNRR